MTFEEAALCLKTTHNLLEEAKILASFEPRRRSKHGLTLREIAHKLGKTYSWVRRRLALLQLPEAVQKAAAEGVLTVTDLDVITSGEKRLWRRTAARVLKDIDEGRRTSHLDSRRKCTRQTPARMRQMLVYLANKQIGGLPARMLVWCMGRLPDSEIYTDIKEYANDTDSDRDGPVLE
jgi:transcriptional regulator with XRE-family HTH domain